METAKDQPISLAVLRIGAAAAVSGRHLLRFPLRSATKSKDAKPETEEMHPTSAARRLKITPNVSKSLNALDLSGKGKSVKDPRGVSDHVKPVTSSSSITFANLTPISENRRDRWNPNNDTPMPDASKSTHRRKFCALSSVSYWLGQIKLSESASKHSISLAFFRLALESGVEKINVYFRRCDGVVYANFLCLSPCEYLEDTRHTIQPLNRIREELKSYVLKHNLLEELGDATKDTLHSYNIVDDFEKLQILECRSQSAEDETQNSKELAKNSGTVSRARNLAPNFSRTKTLAESKAANESAGTTAPVTSQQPGKQQMSKGKGRIKASEKNSTTEEVDDSAKEESKLDDKENAAAKSSDSCSSEEANLKSDMDRRWGVAYQHRVKPCKD
ncbi:hypothetical protein KSP40_PGU006860 [Platanthera guangdongensis]|uniref:Uncharacterized protein n=1 Tax=Platanthera guangdongensis TaxID=2320717 RepID=A0ABR2M1F4_9ASPA